MVYGEIDFLVIGSGLILTLNQQKPKLPGVSAGREITVCARMRVIPALHLYAQALGNALVSHAFGRIR